MKLADILVPIDFSPGSFHALQEAAGLARQSGAQLTLLHVHPIEAVAFMDFTYVEPPEHVAEVTAAAERELQAMVDKLDEPPPRHRVVVTTGRVVDDIV